MIMRRLGLPLLFNPDPNVRPSPQHLTCKMLRNALGDEKYDHYYKFTFIRNPWARILSDYYWRQTLPKKTTTISFADFVNLVQRTVSNGNYYDQKFGDHFIPQVEYTRDVDDVFRFENIKYGITSVASKLKIPVPDVPPKKLKPHDEYWNFYNTQTQKIIHDVYREEIEAFKYEFGI